MTNIKEFQELLQDARAKVSHDLKEDRKEYEIKGEKHFRDIEGNYKDLLSKLAYTKNPEEQSLLAEIFEDLGDIRINCAKLSANLKDYTDAAIFYQYALSVMHQAKEKEDKNGLKDFKERMYEKLSSIKTDLLQKISPNKAVSQGNSRDSVEQDTELLKQKLGELRKTFKDQMNSEQPQTLFQRIADVMKNFLAEIYETCQNEIDTPRPCEYAVIGLGSMAMQQMTPYSDLEFAILIEKDNPQIKEYFKNLTHLVHFKIINLGETSIPYDRFNLDLDDLINIGVNFDLGGKTPLGREDKPYELICTVDEMLKHMRNAGDKQTHIDKYLPYILEKTCYVYGDKTLSDDYKNKLGKFLSIDENAQTRAMKILSEEAIELNYLKIADRPEELRYKGNIEALKPSLPGNTGLIFNVKQDIYRLPDRLIYSLGIYYGVLDNSAWDIVNKLENKGIISEIGAKNLRLAIDFATSLRLKTYSHNEAQREDLSIFSNEQKREEDVQKMLRLEQKDLTPDGALFKYFYTALALHKKLEEFCKQDKDLNKDSKDAFFKDTDFYTDDNLNKGFIHYRLLQYKEALQSLEYALESTNSLDAIDSNSESNFIQLRSILGNIYSDFGLEEKAIEQFQHCLNFYLYQSNNQIDAAHYYDHLGQVYVGQCKYPEAIESYKEGLKIREKIYENELHKDISDSYSYLGTAYNRCGDHTLAIKYHKKNLTILELIYKNIPHKDIANSYNNLAEDYINIGKYKKAIEYYEKSLTIRKLIYKNEPHLDVAISLEGLGLAYWYMSKYEEAISYHERSLIIKKLIYKNDPHPHIANSLNNLAEDYRALGKYEEAVDYYTQNIEMRKKIHGDTPHIGIINSLNGLGLIYLDQKHSDTDKAMKYFIDSLEMAKEIYKDKEHPFIAIVQNNIGNCYSEKRQFSEAVTHYTDSIEIAKKIHGDNPHDDIVRPLCNLGKCYWDQGDQEKAVEHYTSSIEIARKLHGDNPHDNIAFILNRLGIYTFGNKKYDDAIKYYTASLEMRQNIYKNNESHPYVLDSLINLAEAYSKKALYSQAINYSRLALQASNPDTNTNDQALKDIVKEIIEMFLTSYSFIDFKISSLIQKYCLEQNYIGAIKECELVLEMNKQIENLAVETEFCLPKFDSEVITLPDGTENLQHNDTSLQGDNLTQD